jgi:hypothetical protein
MPGASGEEQNMEDETSGQSAVREWMATHSESIQNYTHCLGVTVARSVVQNPDFPDHAVCAMASEINAVVVTRPVIARRSGTAWREDLLC